MSVYWVADIPYNVKFSYNSCYFFTIKYDHSVIYKSFVTIYVNLIVFKFIVYTHEIPLKTC